MARTRDAARILGMADAVFPDGCIERGSASFREHLMDRHVPAMSAGGVSAGRGSRFAPEGIGLGSFVSVLVGPHDPPPSVPGSRSASKRDEDGLSVPCAKISCQCEMPLLPHISASILLRNRLLGFRSSLLARLPPS